ncbi:MAG: CCA tRNA nucleotidyltransferase [Bryobacteraceae bacterium]
MNAEALARRICATLRARGHAAYLVGGCVRDLLLGRAPKDYDVATAARPEVVIELFPRAELVGAHFGVVHVREEGAQVEVATFRSDRSYSDGRRPDSVDFESGPRADALRRDFTINALLLDPETGGVLDFTGGREDLANGVIRAIGSAQARFREDHLRLLRAVRFAARFGFRIDESTAAAIRECRALARDVAAERVRDEILRILTEGGARRGFELLDELGLLEETLPEVAAMKGVEQPPEFHPEGDVWIHTLLMLEGLEAPGATLALGVLLHDVGKPPTFRVAERIRFDGHVEVGARMAVAILTRLRCSADQIRQVESLVANHLRFKDAPHMRESTLRRFLRLDRFEEHLELHRLDCLSSHRRLEAYEMVKAKWASLEVEQLRPQPLLTGDDLIALGYAPGPEFGRVLAALEDAQLESSVETREDAVALVRELFRTGDSGTPGTAPLPPS